MNNPIADFTCGMLLVQGILLALVARQKTGPGADRDGLAAPTCMIFSQLQEAAQWLNTGMTLNWGHLPMGGPLPDEGRDRSASSARSRPNPLRDLCGVFGIEDLSSTDPSSGRASPENFAHAAELEAILARELQEEDHRGMAGASGGHRFLCVPGAVAEGGARGSRRCGTTSMVIEMDHPQGKIKVVGNTHQAG